MMIIKEQNIILFDNYNKNNKYNNIMNWLYLSIWLPIFFISSNFTVNSFYKNIKQQIFPFFLHQYHNYYSNTIYNNHNHNHNHKHNRIKMLSHDSYDSLLFCIKEDKIHLLVIELRKSIINTTDTKDTNDTYSKVIHKFIDAAAFVLKSYPTFSLYIDANEIHFSDKKFLHFIVELKKTIKKTYPSELFEKTVIYNCSKFAKTIAYSFFTLFVSAEEMKKIIFE